MTKISVIVPCYNVENYLEKCLTSLLNQTLKDIEIIVVNDGSTDDTQKIIDRFSSEYENIKAFIKPNGGLSDARNFGLNYVSGEYISFIDSDDYIREDMLELMYNKAKKNKLHIVVCDFINKYSDGTENRMKSNLHYSDDDVKNYIISSPTACLRIYKKEIFDNIRFKKGIFYEDLFLTPSLVLKTKKIGFVEEGLYYYLQRDGSIMRQNNFSEKLLDIFDVLQENKNNLYKEYPLEVEYLYITHLLRTATLRFLNYKDASKYLEKIVDIMKTEFPNWRKNPYYKKSSKKLRLICFLAYNRCYNLLKVMKKISKN